VVVVEGYYYGLKIHRRLRFDLSSRLPQDCKSSGAGFFAGNNGSYQQFLNYLGASDELSEIKYIFNGNKATITDVKNAFKDLFLAKGNEIFSRMNPSFRENLLGLGNENRFDIFQQKINDLGSNLYEFIKL
jgi:hypothetical protein